MSFAQDFRSTHFLLLGLATWLLNSAPLQARLGESELQCNLRYGRSKNDNLEKVLPLLVGALHRVYSVSGWEIHIAFVNGIAVREEYHKPVSVGGPMFNEDDIKAILEGEGNEQNWVAQVKPPLFTISTILDPKEAAKAAKASTIAKTWQRTDGSLALLREPGMILRLESAEAEKLDEQAKLDVMKKQKQSIPKF